MNSFQGYLSEGRLLVDAPHFVAIIDDNALCRRATIIPDLSDDAIFGDSGVTDAIELEECATAIGEEVRAAGSIVIEVISTRRHVVYARSLPSCQKSPVASLPMKAAGRPHRLRGLGSGMYEAAGRKKKQP